MRKQKMDKSSRAGSIELQKIEYQLKLDREKEATAQLKLLNINRQNRRKIAVKMEQRGIGRKQPVEQDLQMADACSRRSDFNLCLSILTLLHTQYPNRTDIITRIAIAYKKIRQYAKASLFFRKLVELQPLNCQHYIEASRTLMLERKVMQALKLFQQGESQIGNVSIFFNYEKGNILYQVIRFQEAFVTFRKTFESNSIFLPGHLGMARVWSRYDNIQGLKSIMQSLNFISPNNVICQAFIQCICLKIKQYQVNSKIPRFHVSLEFQSSQYEDILYSYLGQLYYLQYDYKAALFYLKKYKEMNKKRAPTYEYAIKINKIGFILTELKNANEAIEHFEWLQRQACYKDKRFDALICLNLAHLGRYHEIQQKMPAILQFVKNNQTNKAAAEIVQGYWVEVCFISGMYKEAVEHYEKFRAENPYQYENNRILSIFFTLKCYCALEMMGKAKECFLRLREHRSYFLRSEVGFNPTFNSIIRWGIENGFREIAAEMVQIGQELSRLWSDVINQDFLEEYRSLLEANKAILEQSQ